MTLVAQARIVGKGPGDVTLGSAGVAVASMVLPAGKYRQLDAVLFDTLQQTS